MYSGRVPNSNADETTEITLTSNIGGLGAATGRATWGQVKSGTCQQVLAEEPVTYEPVEE